MPIEFSTSAALLLTAAGTYLLHSTILLGAVWLLLSFSTTKSFLLRERLWKLAAALGFVTTTLQLAGGFSTPLWQWSLWQQPQTVVVTPPVVREAAVLTDQSDNGNPEPREFVFPQLDENISEPTVFSDFGTVEKPLVILNDEPTENACGEFVFPVTAEEIDSPTVEQLEPAEATRAMPTPAIVIAWLLGLAMAWGSIRLGLQTMILRRRLGRCVVVTGGAARDMLDRLLKRASVRHRIRLLSSTACNDPLAFGLFRWTIVLPAGIENRLQRDELQALLAHETAHLVRRDVPWLWVGHLLCGCFAWQPLNLLARRRWQRAAENLCDDWAVRQGTDSLSLARCLTQVAQWQVARRSQAAGLAATGTSTDLTVRVERLIDNDRRDDPWQSKFRRRTVSVAAMLAATALVCWGPKALVLAKLNTAPVDQSASVSLEDTSQWQELDLELLELGQELDRVGQLLQQAPRDPEITALGQRLVERKIILETRRRELAARFASPQAIDLPEKNERTLHSPRKESER